MEFRLKLMDEKLINCKSYPLRHEKLEVVRNEFKDMVALGVIEPAQSPYSSPVVLVRKKDQSHRFCIDFRKLNRITEFEVETLPDPEYIFAKVSSAKYFSKLDSSKGYWQVSLLRRRTV